MIWSMSASSSSSSKGHVPVSSACMATPSAHTSTPRPYCPATSASGATYANVPHTFSARSRAVSALANPKSTSVTLLTSPGRASTRFSSLRSRCTTPRACMNAMASSMLRMTILASDSEYPPSAATASTSSGPSRSSITTCTTPPPPPPPFTPPGAAPEEDDAPRAAGAPDAMPDVAWPSASSVKNSLTVTMFGWPESCCIITSSFVISDIDIAARRRDDAGDPSEEPPPPDESESESESEASEASSEASEASAASGRPPFWRESPFTLSVLTANTSPVAFRVAFRTTAKPPVPMASPTSYSAANGLCVCTRPTLSTCAEVSSWWSPAGALRRPRRNARTARSAASDLRANASSPEHRIGAGWNRAFHALFPRRGWCAPPTPPLAPLAPKRKRRDPPGGFAREWVPAPPPPESSVGRMSVGGSGFLGRARVAASESDPEKACVAPASRVFRLGARSPDQFASTRSDRLTRVGSAESTAAEPEAGRRGFRSASASEFFFCLLSTPSSAAGPGPEAGIAAPSAGVAAPSLPSSLAAAPRCCCFAGLMRDGDLICVGLAAFAFFSGGATSPRVLASAMRSGAESSLTRCPRSPEWDGAPLLFAPPSPPPGTPIKPPLSPLSTPFPKPEPEPPPPPATLLTLAHAESPAGRSPLDLASRTSVWNSSLAPGQSSSSSRNSTATRANPLANCVPETAPVAPRYPSSSTHRFAVLGSLLASSTASASVARTSSWW